MSATLAQQLYENALDAPGRELIRCCLLDGEDRALSRAEFYNAAQAAGRRFAEAGASAGDLVIIVQQDMLALTASFFGAALIGAVPSILPFATEKLDPVRYAESMAALLKLAQPKLLATDPVTLNDVSGLLPDEYALNIVVINSDALDLSGDLQPPPSSPDAESVALLQHSSGTTGLQKGVALSHTAIFDQLTSYGGSIGFTEDDVIVSWLPLYHDMGLIAGFLMPVLAGAKLVMMSAFDWVRNPVMLLEAITRHSGTLTWLPNFSYNFLAQKIREKDLGDTINLSSMRAFINCSEPIYTESHRMFAERFVDYGVSTAQLATCYAMAETVFGVTQSEIGKPATVEKVERKALREEKTAIPTESDEGIEWMVSSGKPIDGMQVRILDDNKADLPERKAGDIAVKADFMFSGYHRREDATVDAFHQGWYLTGDIGYIADGEIFVMGRKKDLIIVGGKNVYPRDLEQLASTVEGIHPGRVAAFGLPNPKAGTDDVIIVAETDTTDPAEHKRLMGDVRRVIAAGSDVAVRQVKLVERGWLIKTSSGKVSRSANREKLLNSE